MRDEESRTPVRWRGWRWRIVAVVMAMLAAFAVVGTYRVFSQVYDEPAHIGAGMEWLSAGRYTFEAQHPPLARVAAAVGPFVAGERLQLDEMWNEGNRILGSGAHYQRTLALARLGELPFLLVLCLGGWLWGHRLAGEAGGALAVLFAATNPNILAHAGLATTDIAPAALLPLALFTFMRWREQPDARRSVVLGACCGLAVVTKFSIVAFLLPALLLAWGLSEWSEHAPGTENLFAGSPIRARALVLAVLVAALVVWATYRFDVGPLPGTSISLPAPQFFAGILDFATHGGLGHSAFLLGHLSARGWWYYFPVVIAVKTPLPLLAAGIVGIVLSLRSTRRRRDVDGAILVGGIGVVLGVGMATHVNIGVRHILPLYALLAPLAALAVVRSWRASRRVVLGPGSMGTWTARGALGALAAASILIAARANPDFLAYFNPLAGGHPERVLSDSNIDWGQDLHRLAVESERRGIRDMRIAYFGSADLDAVGLSVAHPFSDEDRPTGWVAISETYAAGLWTARGFAWLDDYRPVAEVGRSIRLYWIPPRAQAGAVAQAGAPRGAITRR